MFWGLKIYRCCNYCHLPSDFSSTFQSSTTMFHHKLLTREGRVLANRWIHPSSRTVCSLIHKKCHMKSYHSDINIIWHMTLNIISVALDKVDPLSSTTNSPPTLIGVDHQWMAPINRGYFELHLDLWEALGVITSASRNRSLTACTSKCGWTIS